MACKRARGAAARCCSDSAARSGAATGAGGREQATAWSADAGALPQCGTLRQAQQSKREQRPNTLDRGARTAVLAQNLGEMENRQV